LIPFGNIGRLNTILQEVIMEEYFAPIEQMPQLVRQLTRAVKESGIPDERWSEILLEERIRTLREKYPDFAQRYMPDEPPTTLDD
jgi:hypothetical protein